MLRRPPIVALATLLVVVAGALPRFAVAVPPAPVARERAAEVHWVGTWSASPQAASSPIDLNDQTVRQVVRVSIGGGKLRVRLSNAYGSRRLQIGAAHVALHSTGTAIVPGSDRVLTFSGSTSATIPPGALLVSDPVELRVPDRGDLAVSLYLPGSQAAATEHTLGLQTTYISVEGDFSGAPALVAKTTTESVYFLTAIEVDAAKGARAIVALGDSITDGYQSTVGANGRWTDRLAERLNARKGVGKVAVLNAGIKGNRLLHDGDGANALARLDRDVLVQSGVRYLIVLVGINDIGFPGAVSTEEIIAGHRQIIDRAHAMGLRVYGATLTPFEAFLPWLYYTAVGDEQRQAVNEWMRTSKAYDGVIDFDQAIRDPSHPTRILPAYDSGDNLHPNDAGYRAMADAIDLTLFADRVPARRPAAARSPSAQTTKPKPALCPCPQ